MALAKPSTKLKVIYYSTCLVIFFVSALLCLALTGVLVALFTGDNVPILLPIIFIGFLVLLFSGLHASGFFYVLRRIWRYNLYVSKYYDVKRYFLSNQNVSITKTKHWRTEIYNLKVEEGDIIIFPATVILPTPERVIIHLIPRGWEWRTYVDKYLTEKTDL